MVTSPMYFFFQMVKKQQSYTRRFPCEFAMQKLLNINSLPKLHECIIVLKIKASMGPALNLCIILLCVFGFVEGCIEGVYIVELSIILYKESSLSNQTINLLSNTEVCLKEIIGFF